MIETKLSLKNYKGTRGIEGSGFTCNLCVGGVVACHVSDWGDGGPINYHWVNEDLKNSTLASVGNTPGTTLDLLVANLVDEHVLQVKIARMCKTRTVFTLPTDPWGTIRHIKDPYTPKVKEHILSRYPNAVIHNVG